ncbi:MAG: Zn-ribbon domain-containing OB-fold protein [Candidatus Binatia bacterium]
MKGAPEGLPLPEADALTAPFWEACAEHRLVVQRCTRCGAFGHPPRPLCPRCQSREFEWVESRGLGEIFTYTIAHHAVHPAVKDQVPYGVIVVKLDDCGGVLVTSNLVDAPVERLRVGLRVSLVWDDLAEGIAVPRFVLERPGD